METLLFLLALVLVVAYVVPLLLLTGARSRLSDLERTIRKQDEQLQRLAGLNTALTAQAPEEGATRPSKGRAVPAPGEAQPASSAEIDYGPVFVPKAPDPAQSPPPKWTTQQGTTGQSTTGQSAPVQGTPGQGTAGQALKPAATLRKTGAPAAAIRPSIPRQLPASAPPPAWLIHARAWLFGGNLVAKAGLLILFFGVSFLLKYAAARVSVPIELRLAGVVLADIGLLIWGWRIREARASISLPVQGTALGILMLMTFGAFRLYELIPGGTTFALLFLLTFFTCLLAVLQDAPWLAVFGIVGGFAAPILTSTGQGSHNALFSYYALLNAGILAIALKRSWRLLNLLGFACTFLIATAWGVLRYQPENYPSVQVFLILFFAFYVAIAVLYASRQAPRLRSYVDGTLVFGTPLLAFSLQAGIIRDKPFGLAFSALAFGLFYIALTLALWRRRGDTLKLLVESFLALAIVFGTLAIPFSLDGRWTSAAWALEGAAIVWVGLRQRQPLAWMFGVLVQVGSWISYLAAISELQAEAAARSNLWLGFLLLAGSGFIMATSFRKESRADAEKPESAPIVATLATVFLGFSAFWLLTGLWSEIFLRDSAHAHTLYVLSAMAIAAILGLLAARLQWRVARYFALVPQLLAALLFLWLLNSGGNPPWRAVSDNLLDSGFLGGLMIALGAGFSSRTFHRQPEARYRLHSRILLGWCGLWWFVYVLASLNGWGEHILASHELFTETTQPLVHPLYCLCLALGSPLFAYLAGRWQWNELRWLAAAVWPGLLFATLQIFLQLDSHLAIPSWPVWFAFIALWSASEWLLLNGGDAGWLTATRRPLLLRILHTLRTVGPWLVLWPLGDQLVSLGLQADTPEQAALLAEGGWFTAGSWARYLPAWAMMAYVALLIPRARREGWPTASIAAWYRGVLIPLGALWSVAVAVVWNFTQNGLMAPLPYLPLLNPLDLTTGYAMLLALATWKLYGSDGKRVLPGWGLQSAAYATYVWCNLMLLRSAAQFLDIPYQVEALFQSQFVQAMLSLTWSATALLVMRFAKRRLLRAPWMAGAALLLLVIVKLFLVDLSNAGGIERVVSFLGVGILMLAIGYLAPFPTEKSSAAS